MWRHSEIQKYLEKKHETEDLDQEEKRLESRIKVRIENRRAEYKEETQRVNFWFANSKHNSEYEEKEMNSAL